MSFLVKTLPLGTTDTEIYMCPTTQAGAVHGLVFSNVTESAASFSLKIYSQSSGLTTSIAVAREVPANSEFAWPKPINITAGDKIIASSSVDSALTAVASVYIAGSTPALTGFRARGDWSSVATYEINDIVHNSGSSYIAVYQNSNSAPPSANWMIASDRGDVGISVKGEYSSVTQYALRDVVISPVNHWLYRATSSVINKEPSQNAAEWVLFLQNDTVSAASAHASAASASAGVASDSAVASSASASAASNSATTAATQVGLASVQALAASESATQALNSAASMTDSVTAAANSAAEAANSRSGARVEYDLVYAPVGCNYKERSLKSMQ